MSSTASDSRILILDPQDNIGVATRELAAGTRVQIGNRAIELLDSIDIGHKFALHAIEQGTKIIKYQAPIGHASRDIRAGEYVHTHNMASDYLPTYTLNPSAEQREHTP